MNVPDVVIEGLPNAKPLVAGGTIILAVWDAMHVLHVDLNMAPPLYKLEAHKALKAIASFVDLILQQIIHVAGGVFICKEGEQTCQLLFGTSAFIFSNMIKIHLRSGLP